MIRRLRWKLILINMVLVTFILLTMGLLMVVSTRDNLRQRSMSLLYRAASEEFSVHWPRRGEGMGGREDVPLPYFTVALGMDGTTVLLENQFGAVEDMEQLAEIVRSCMTMQPNTGELRGYRLRYLRQRSMLGWRIVFADTSQEEETVRALIRHLLVIGLGTLLAFFFISLLLARWAVGPVEESWKQQRRFVSDASHELKTPLTVILSNVDLLEGGDFSPREQRWLDNIRSSSAQMTQLVEELLTLARSDDLTEANRIRETVDLSELTEDEALLFEPTLYEAGKTLREEIQEGLCVTGDPSKLRQMVEILLDNARKYAQSGTEVTLTLRAEGARRVRLSVNTRGEPIPREELSRIFERFYRRDESRSSAGFGLGLSIAAAVAQEHGGRLWAESSEESGNTFHFSMARISQE